MTDDPKISLPPPRRVQASATFTGHYLADLELIHSQYCTGNKLGDALLPAVELAAKQIRDALKPQLALPIPVMDWDKGDPLPTSGAFAPEPEPNPQLQSIIDIFNEPLPYERPKKLPTKSQIPTQIPTDTPTITARNRKVIHKIYFRDNYLQDCGSPRSREVSASTLKLLLDGHSIKPGSDIWDLIERDMKKMQTYPDYLEKWFVPNPRWPQADYLIYGKTAPMSPPPKYEV